MNTKHDFLNWNNFKNIFSISILLFLITSCTIIPQSIKVKGNLYDFNSSLNNVEKWFNMENKKTDDSTFFVEMLKPDGYGSKYQFKLKLAMDKNDSFQITTIGRSVSKNDIPIGPENDLACILNSAIQQELSIEQGSPIYNKKLPRKTWNKFIILDLINPGLAVSYAYNNPLTPKITPVLGGTLFGAYDIWCIYYMFSGDNSKTLGMSNVGTSIFCMAAMRLIILLPWKSDGGIYRILQKSPYYFTWKDINNKIYPVVNINF